MTTIARLCVALLVVLLAGCGSTTAARRSERLDPGDSKAPSARLATRYFVLSADEFDREVRPQTDRATEGAPSQPSVETHEESGPAEHKHMDSGTPAPQPKATEEPKRKPVRVESRAPLYACPMHPEVTDTKPSKCPKCGMTLVRKVSK